MKYLVLLFALIAAPLSAQTALPPAPYANQQIADPALERKAKGIPMGQPPPGQPPPMASCMMV